MANFSQPEAIPSQSSRRHLQQPNSCVYGASAPNSVPAAAVTQWLTPAENILENSYDTLELVGVFGTPDQNLVGTVIGVEGFR